MPKPVVEILGNPHSIKYVVNDDNNVQLVSGSSHVFKAERARAKKLTSDKKNKGVKSANRRT
ncbi:MAG TPA: hypothetical protein VE130_01520 [Nitrososphaeraceae archaeon]|nr:hypothetical protein [Nitrososphaeraceae archaeon]